MAESIRFLKKAEILASIFLLPSQQDSKPCYISYEWAFTKSLIATKYMGCWYYLLKVYAKFFR